MPIHLATERPTEKVQCAEFSAQPYEICESVSPGLWPGAIKFVLGSRVWRNEALQRAIVGELEKISIEKTHISNASRAHHVPS